MVETPLRIRDFYRQDLDVLYAIDRICFPADIAFSRRDFRDFLGQGGSILRIADVSARISGFLLGRMEKSSLGRIITLDVVPGARRCGIGSALMEDFHRILERNGVRAAVLEVGTGNLGALRLYERMNYRRIGTLPGYYNGNEDALRMTRSI
ncbi:MAG: GNAT family N-acetyltransferase [Acidobacteria bacterium]|nr:GNAT family N-acetyltransferase [Acidobacteriota bacterium]